MSNKYLEFSKVDDRILDNMCRNKAQYDTRELAYQKGQDCYQCIICHKWHRTTIIKGKRGKMRKFSL